MSDTPITYIRLAFPSAQTHLKDAIGILSNLYPRLSLHIGALCVIDSDGIGFEGMLQMKISPLLYPTTTLLPKGHAQHAEVTFFVSC